MKDFMILPYINLWLAVIVKIVAADNFFFNSCFRYNIIILNTVSDIRKSWISRMKFSQCRVRRKLLGTFHETARHYLSLFHPSTSLGRSCWAHRWYPHVAIVPPPCCPAWSHSWQSPFAKYHNRNFYSQLWKLIITTSKWKTENIHWMIKPLCTVWVIHRDSHPEQMKKRTKGGTC